jgi:hypothetical protein
MEKQRTTIFFVLIVLGAGLLAYGLSSTAAPGASSQQGQLSSASEPAATQEVAQVAGVQEPSSQVQKKEAEPTKAPAACPT